MNPSSSSSSQAEMSSTHLVFSKRGYAPFKTCSIPTSEMEVLCESSVDLENLKVHGFKPDAKTMAQGWSNYLDRLVGPIYPTLVKDFWAHATVTPTAMISFMLGHEVVITEKLISKLYNLDDEEGCTGPPHARVSWPQVERQISYVTGLQSHQTGTLRAFYQVWAEIILGSLHHRRRSLSSMYIGPDHKYTLFCIGRRIELNISNILFQNLKMSIEESRDGEREKYPHLPRNTIPFAIVISEILIESDLMDSLRAIGTSKFFGVIQGHVINAFYLLRLELIRLELIREVTSAPVIFPDILTRRI